MGRVRTLQQPIQRILSLFVGVLLVIVFAAQLLPSFVDATGGQVTTRSITMSTSAPSATNATYTVQFTPATTETHPDVIIDFCNATSDPIVGDTCSGTAGTDVPDLSGAAAAGWTVTAIDSNHGVKLTTSTISFTAGTAISPIVLTGITNMSNVATGGSTTAGNFYGRILDYANGGAGTNTSASPGTYVDYGGIALSTASNISITSKVFETLSFCVFQSACGTAPVLILGNSTTGALSVSGAYVNANAQYTIATNAASGVNVTMTGTTLCRSATPSNCNTGTAGAYTITSIGSTATASATGTEQFGMCEDTNSLPTGVTVPATYTDSTATKCHGLTTGSFAGTSTFGFNDSTSSGGTNNASGSTVLSSTGAISSFTGTLGFLGNVANTTEAGIYTTSLNMVATGTF